FGARDVARLLGDAGIVRHRGKIEAAIQNAKALRAVQREHGSFANHVWSFAPRDDARVPRKHSEIPAVTDASIALARDLKRRGFCFVGPPTVYAFMQAMGLVNDHLAGCASRGACARARRLFMAPGGR